MENKRVSDSMGDLNIPADALYGAQTARAIKNFPVSGRPVPRSFIRALLLAKLAAAEANVALKLLAPNIAQAVAQAVQDLLADPQMMRHFPIDMFQTGSGTSSNMNANEVLASLVSSRLGQSVHPNDAINLGQSSNDIIPSAIHISALLAVEQSLLPSLTLLSQTITAKAQQLGDVTKTGRTHLMDAMPIRFDQVLGGWGSQIDLCRQRLVALSGELAQLPVGGTAVGTGVNTHEEFSRLFCERLSALTRTQFRPADNLFSRMASHDTAVALSGQLKTLAVAIMKISNDLCWMNSGPLAGIGEISLQPLQPGSSIMPGKVNPVIPESACMVAAQVMGNDMAITVAGQSGNFELNVMQPLLAVNLLESIEILGNVSRLLADKAIASFVVNRERIAASLHRNPILVTALSPKVGYVQAAKIVKQAYQEQRPILEVAMELTDLSEEELRHLLDPERLTGVRPHRERRIERMVTR
ncbi:class II fumarate hydratase [Shewanella sp. Isolate7]|uniref:class II fumarate hydratase n=1 Tax=Shewanella sp. Isolate7 TaxID=2908528 RepID=UPI001EFD0557|nr:class II fumarate hydratase [Shewanella sp. Isolate7]MCG9719946.1 class II fumarate hydratase [Shewanella sp. Isolate7]